MYSKSTGSLSKAAAVRRRRHDHGHDGDDCDDYDDYDDYNDYDDYDEKNNESGPESPSPKNGSSHNMMSKSSMVSASTPNLVRGGAGEGPYSRKLKRPYCTGLHLPGLQINPTASVGSLSLNGVVLDAESVRSENLQVMPMNLPLEAIQVRSEIEVQKIDVAMANKSIREKGKMKKHQEKITEKYTRVQRYKEQRERQELQRSWMVTLVHHFSLSVMPERCRAHYEERMDAMRVDALAERIQRLSRRVQLKKQWADLSKFYGHIAKCKWHLGLQIRCWRRWKAAELVTQFVLDASKLGDGCKVVAKFAKKIRRLQNVTKDFLATTRGRVKVLSRLLDEVAEDWVSKKQRLLDNDATMAKLNVKVKKSNRFRKAQVEDINKTVAQWKKTDARFQTMIQKQKDLGRCVMPNKLRIVPFLGDARRRQVCWNVLHDARMVHVANIEVAVQKQHEAAKKMAGTSFTVDDVSEIIFPTNGGYVMKIDPMRNASDATKVPFFCFWTSFKPKSIREVLFDAYGAAHMEEYGDVVKKEMDRRRDKAMKGALLREDQNRRARAKRAALKEKLLGTNSAKPSMSSDEKKKALERVAASAAKAREEAAAAAAEKEKEKEKENEKKAKINKPVVNISIGSIEIVDVGTIAVSPARPKSRPGSLNVEPIPIPEEERTEDS